jgi:EAL domain-containing protein (putative c-di-GMP-specific phosphodiesterase class I)
MQETAKAASAQPAPCILVVDDDPVFAAIMEQFLIRHGAGKVATAGDGETALELIASRPAEFGCIILDLSMPRLDGIRFLRRIARAGFTGSIAVVSGEPPSVRDSARRLARMLGLTCIGAWGKPADFDAIALAALNPKTPSVRTPAPAVDAEEINKALRRAQLHAHYQPRVDLATGEVVGAEALARMTGSDGRLLDAGQMINLAERDGSITDITWRMIEVVAQDAADLAREFGRPLVLSFNISGSILANENFAGALGDILRQSGLAPEYFVVELTESCLPEDHVRSLETLTLLRMQGFGLAIDDFGTGYSNIEHLRNYPFSELKIDRSFISRATHDRFALACVRACVALARELSMSVVGEGIETERDLALARDCGIDLGQGYLFARPLPLAEFTEFARRGQPGDAQFRKVG